MKQIWKRLIGDVGQIHPRPQHARVDGLWHTAGPKAEWAEMWRPGPWPIMARAACGTQRMGQHGDRGHSCHGGVARGGATALTGGQRRGAEFWRGRERKTARGLTKNGARQQSQGKLGISARRTPARCRWKAPERRRPLGGESCPWLPMNG
jgi:hypothetical protein